RRGCEPVRVCDEVCVCDEVVSEGESERGEKHVRVCICVCVYLCMCESVCVRACVCGFSPPPVNISFSFYQRITYLFPLLAAHKGILSSWTPHAFILSGSPKQPS